MSNPCGQTKVQGDVTISTAAVNDHALCHTSLAVTMAPITWLGDRPNPDVRLAVSEVIASHAALLCGTVR